MLSAEQNALVTEAGAGTPGGALMRRYWQPAALVEELAEERPLAPVRLMGEDLVLFRADDGGLRLTARRCPHRGADLRFGRLEDGGIRCPFHGWLFDVEGNGASSSRRSRRAATSTAKVQACRPIPASSATASSFAYLGPGDPPPDFPDFDCYRRACDAHSFAFKGWISNANWLQAPRGRHRPLAHLVPPPTSSQDENPDEGLRPASSAAPPGRRRRPMP